MIIRIKFICLLFILCSCSTYKIANRYTAKKLSKSGLHLKELQTGNYKITYWDSEGDKPVLILLHGFGASTQFQWYKQVEDLKSSYRLILSNLIYFGGSTAKIPISSISEQVDAMQTLIDQLGIKTFSLCGASYGGLVSAELALKNQNRVKKLILCDAPIKFMNEKDIQLICEKFHVNSVDQLLVPDDYKKLKPLLNIAYLHPPKVPSLMFRSVYKNMYVSEADGQKRLLESLETEKELFASKEYHYKFPVLLIWGAEDKLIPIKVGVELQKHIGANSRLEVIPNTAHMPCLEASKAFNKILIGFLKE
jgi:pimeloyl-ACP methyl ester carboxylesterase